MVCHLDQQHTHISKRIPDPVDVLLHTRHQLPRVRPVKKIRAQALDMAEQIAPHVSRYPHAVLIERILFDILEDTSPQSDAQKSQKQIFQFGEFSSHNDIIDYARHEPW